jgi:hypothetical protein
MGPEVPAAPARCSVERRGGCIVFWLAGRVTKIDGGSL